MRFFLTVSLVFAGAWQTTAISANSRIVTLLQGLPAKSADIVGKKTARFVVGAGFIGLALSGTITGCERCQQMLPAVGGVEETADDDTAGQFGLLGRFIPLFDEGVQDTQLGHFVQPFSADFRAIPNHRDIGAKVNLLGEIDGRTVQRWGEVIDVYDNGYYRIKVNREAYTGDGPIPPLPLQQPYILVHHNLPWGDGGFAIMSRRN